MKTKSAVIITIHDSANMTTKGRKRIVAWMRRQAGFLEKFHEELGKTYVARWRYKT